MLGLARDVANFTHMEYKYLQADGKRQYDRKVQSSRLQPLDRMLARHLSEQDGAGKLP